jgi:predicted porin
MKIATPCLTVTLAAAVLAVGLPARAQTSNVSIYGLLNLDVEAVRGKQVDGSNPTVPRISSNSSRWGIRGSEPLGGGLSAFFQLEYALSPDDGGSSSVGAQAYRDTFVGLQDHWGSVQLGYFLAPYDDISPLFGSVPTFLTSILSTSTLWSQGAQPKANGGFDARLPNSIRYDAPIVAGFTGSVQWSLGENPNLAQSNSHVLSAAGFYAHGPLELGLGFERNVDIRAANLRDDALSFAGNWDFGPVRVGGVYERLRYQTLSGDLTRDFWGVSATVPLGPAGSVYAFYGNAGNGRGSATEGARVGSLARGPDTGAEQWTISYTYRLSKRFVMYSGYNYIRNDANATYNFYVNRYPVAVGANPSGWVLGTAHFF